LSPYSWKKAARVAEHGLAVVANHPYSAPYEDLTLKAK
jgi:hypothetical protein